MNLAWIQLITSYFVLCELRHTKQKSSEDIKEDFGSLSQPWNKKILTWTFRDPDNLFKKKEDSDAVLNLLRASFSVWESALNGRICFREISRKEAERRLKIKKSLRKRSTKRKKKETNQVIAGNHDNQNYGRSGGIGSYGSASRNKDQDRGEYSTVEDSQQIAKMPNMQISQISRISVENELSKDDSQSSVKTNETVSNHATNSITQPESASVEVKEAKEEAVPYYIISNGIGSPKRSSNDNNKEKQKFTNKKKKIKYEKPPMIDIDVLFAKYDHGDRESFDGPGGTVAHSGYPPEGVLHFDGSEKWTTHKGGKGIDLRIVALHEIGHVLGLKHIWNEESIMNPFYSTFHPTPQLSPIDLKAIQKLYRLGKYDRYRIL